MAASGKKGGGAMVLIIVVFLLSIAGAGAGFTVGTLISGEPAPAAAKPEETAEKPAAEDGGHGEKPAGKEQAAAGGHGEAANETAAAEPEAEEEEPVDPHTLKVIPFPPVLTTLAEPKGKWIRLEGSILAGAEGETPPELLAEKAGEHILAYLRTLKLSQIEGPSGYLGLKGDLTETVKVLSGGEVHGVLIHGLIVE